MLTIAEAAEHLKVSTKTIQRMLDAGILKGKRLGERGSIRIPESAFADLPPARPTPSPDTPAT